MRRIAGSRFGSARVHISRADPHPIRGRSLPVSQNRRHRYAPHSPGPSTARHTPPPTSACPASRASNETTTPFARGSAHRHANPPTNYPHCLPPSRGPSRVARPTGQRHGKLPLSAPAFLRFIPHRHTALLCSRRRHFPDNTHKRNQKTASQSSPSCEKILEVAGESVMEDTGQAGPAENLPEPEPLSPAVEAGEVVVEDEADGDGFSFPVAPVAADACIVPVYPIFGRPPSPPLREEEEEEPEPETATVRVPLGRLLLEEREFRAREREQDGRSASARRAWQEEDEDLELEGVPPDTYCLWAPGGGQGQSSAPASPRRCRKSGSTGSVLRWRRISERLVGRSHSDGKEKFVFLTAAAAAAVPEPPRRSIKEEEEGGGGINKGGDADTHQLRYYGRGGGGSGSRRRSYLPYKQELVGLFANVSGLRRSYHPF